MISHEERGLPGPVLALAMLLAVLLVAGGFLATIFLLVRAVARCAL